MSGHHVAAVVVTYNRRDVLLDTLGSVLDQSRLPDSIVVVDNNSSDGTKEALLSRYPDVDYIHLDDNRGFAAGLEAGMQSAIAKGAHFCWLLDDDSQPRPTALGQLLDASLAVPRTGVVGLSGGMLRWGVPDRRAPMARVPEYPQANRCDFVLVDGALVSAETAQDIGFPRSDFFMMLEDVEYTSRAQRAGWGVLVLDEDLIDRGHLGSGGGMAGGSAPPWRGYYQARNHVAVALSHRSAIEFAGALSRQLRIIVFTLARGNRKSERVRLRLLGLWHGLRGNMGKTLDPRAHP